MKREAIAHTKTAKLGRLLGIEKWGAVGILESLWHLTARQAPEGNIGKLEDIDIADGIGWKGDVTNLIDALVESGWVDTSDVHRLIVHDWSEHADDLVHARVARSRKLFSDGKHPKISKLPKDEREECKQYYGRIKSSNGRVKSSSTIKNAACLALPSQAKPKPEIKTLPAFAGASEAAEVFDLTDAERAAAVPEIPGVSNEQLDQAATRIHQRHPAPRRCTRGEVLSRLKAILRREPAGKRMEVLRTIDSNHEAYCETEQWTKDGGEFAKGLDNWLAPTKGRWQDPPARASPGLKELPGHMNPGLID